MNIEELTRNSTSLRSLFIIARGEEINLHASELRAGRDGFKILTANDDYALIEIAPDPGDESVIPGKFALPYQGSIMYSTNFIN